MADNQLIPVVTGEIVYEGDGKGIHKRTSADKKRDRELIKKLYFFDKQGITEIAKNPALQHISKTQVYNDLEIVKKMWKGSPDFDKNFERKKLVSELELSAKESIKSFYLSQGRKVRKVERKKVGPNFDPENPKPEDLYTFQLEETTEEYGPGDPNFLKAFNETVKLRAIVMGVNMSPKTEININPGDKQIIGMIIK
jgi:hypothetical protein